MLNVVSFAPVSSSRMINFQGRSSADVKDLSYKNVLGNPLKSTPNMNFESNLKKVPNIKSMSKAMTRVSNLSRYLKEDMVGFVIPEYTIKGQKKGGEQWFQKGAEYLLKVVNKALRKKIIQKLQKIFMDFWRLMIIIGNQMNFLIIY